MDKTTFSPFVQLISRLNKFALDILFPINCLLCKKGDFWICKDCLAKIEIKSSQVCPYCEKMIVPAGKLCLSCKDKFLFKNKIPPIDSLILSSRYKKNSLDRLIHLYKYNFIFDLRIPMGKILVKGYLKNNLPLPDLIIPVPLHPKRLRWRGFNQSDLLAGYLSDNLTPGFKIPVSIDILFRKKFTPPQMKIKNYQLRKDNIKNAFAINLAMLEFIKNKKILLIDDIATTGATLFECGKILKEHGAKEVFAIVLARQEIS